MKKVYKTGVFMLLALVMFSAPCYADSGAAGKDKQDTAKAASTVTKEKAKPKFQKGVRIIPWNKTEDYARLKAQQKKHAKVNKKKASSDKKQNIPTKGVARVVNYNTGDPNTTQISMRNQAVTGWIRGVLGNDGTHTEAAIRILGKGSEPFLLMRQICYPLSAENYKNCRIDSIKDNTAVISCRNIEEAKRKEIETFQKKHVIPDDIAEILAEWKLYRSDTTYENLKTEKQCPVDESGNIVFEPEHLNTFLGMPEERFIEAVKMYKDCHYKFADQYLSEIFEMIRLSTTIRFSSQLRELAEEGVGNHVK